MASTKNPWMRNSSHEITTSEPSRADPTTAGDTCLGNGKIAVECRRFFYTKKKDPQVLHLEFILFRIPLHLIITEGHLWEIKRRQTVSL